MEQWASHTYHQIITNVGSLSLAFSYFQDGHPHIMHPSLFTIGGATRDELVRETNKTIEDALRSSVIYGVPYVAHLLGFATDLEKCIQYNIPSSNWYVVVAIVAIRADREPDADIQEMAT